MSTWKVCCFQALAEKRTALERQTIIYEEVDQHQEESESWLDDIIHKMETCLTVTAQRDPIILQANLNKYQVIHVLIINEPLCSGDINFADLMQTFV